MKLQLVYIYVGLFLIVLAIAVTVFILLRRESYVTLGNLGKFDPKYLPLNLHYDDIDDDEPQSLKYRGHRYERKRIRRPDSEYQ